MAEVSEVEVIKTLDDALGKLEDAQARDRVLHWAWEKYCSKPVPSAVNDPARAMRGHKKEAQDKKTVSKKAKVKTTLSMEKNLNLTPEGKRTFDAFADEKMPTSNLEKCTVAVYYLHNILELPKISANHVFTCFKHRKWRVPTDIPNTLQYTASTQGWLDTSDMGDIKVTTVGENLIDHDLPRNENRGKKP